MFIRLELSCCIDGRKIGSCRFPAKHPIPGQPEGSWQVQWLKEASDTGTGATEHLDPWVNNDGENLCSTVVNKEDCILLILLYNIYILYSLYIIWELVPRYIGV